MSRYEKGRDTCSALKNDLMIPHLPPHRPSEPSRQNTSTYLQKRGETRKSMTAHSIISQFDERVLPSVSSRDDRTPLCGDTMGCTVLRRTIVWISSFIAETMQSAWRPLEQNKARLAKDGSHPPRPPDTPLAACAFSRELLENVSSANEKGSASVIRQRVRVGWKVHLTLTRLSGSIKNT